MYKLHVPGVCYMHVQMYVEHAQYPCTHFQRFMGASEQYRTIKMKQYASNRI